MRFMFLLLLVACAAEGDDLPIDGEDVPFDLGKADGASCILDDEQARGVLALANDGSSTAPVLHDHGLSWKTSNAIVRSRPYATLPELDAVKTVGPYACRTLEAFACAERGLCERELPVWTWNIEHFPLSGSTIDEVVHTLDERQPALVGLEEVDSLPAFDQLMARLPGWEGLPGQTGFDTQVALIYRSDRLRVVHTDDLFPSDSYRFPRPPLAVTFDVLGRHATRRLTVVVVHLKAMVDATSQERRRQAVITLSGWMQTRMAAGEDVLVVGDWNDDIDDPPGSNVFQPMLDRPELFTALTLPLAQQGGISYIPFHRLIDHLIMSEPAGEHFVVEDVATVPLDTTITDYLHRVSDHLPVAARVLPIIPAGT